METYKKLFIREQNLQDFFSIKIHNQIKSKVSNNVNDTFNQLFDEKFKDIKFEMLSKVIDLKKELVNELKVKEDDIYIILKGGNNYKILLEYYNIPNIKEYINKPSDYDFNIILNPKHLTSKNIKKINEIITLSLYKILIEYLNNKSLLIKNNSGFSVVTFSDKKYSQSEYFIYGKDKITVYYDFKDDVLKNDNLFKIKIPNKEKNYFKVTVFENLKNLGSNFNLYRLLINGKIGDTTGFGELIDISLMIDKNSYNNYKTLLLPIELIHKNKNITVMIYNLEGLIKDLVYTILINNLLPSADPKYEKRIDRLISILLIYLQTNYKLNNIIDLQKIIDYTVSKINPKSGINISEKELDTISNPILNYLYNAIKPLILLLSNISINNELFDEKNFIKSKLYKYYELLLTKNDLKNKKSMIIYSKNLYKYREFYYHLVGRLIKLKKELSNKKEYKVSNKLKF